MKKNSEPEDGSEFFYVLCNVLPDEEEAEISYMTHIKLFLKNSLADLERK